MALGPLAAFASLVGTFGKLVSANRDFGLAIATTRGVLGGTIDSVNELDEAMVSLQAAAREAGATTQFTAGQAAEAQTNLARAGLASAAAIGDALVPTLNLAIAGNIELADAARITTKTLKQFGLGTGQAEAAMDILVATSNKTDTTISELAEGMKLVGPIASSAGIGLRETAAAMGTLANSGLTATLGGTSLRAVITQLAKPTSRAEKALQGLAKASGQSRDAFDIQKQGVVGVFEALQRAGAGFDDLNEIFAVRALAGANILVKAKGDTEELNVALGDVTGTSAEMAGIMQDTLNGSIKALQSAFEAFLLTVGIEGGVNGALRTMLGHLTGLFRALSGMEAGVNGVTPAMARMADVLKTLAATFAAIAGSKLLIFLGKILLKLNPITAVVSTLIALWLKFGDEMVTVGETTGTVTDFIKAVFLALGQKIEAIFNVIRAVIQTTWEAVSRVTNDAVNALLEPFRFFGVSIVEVFNAAFETVRDVLLDHLDFIAAAIDTVFRGIVRRGTDAFKALSEVDLTEPIASAKRILDALNPVDQIQQDIDQFELSLENKLVTTFAQDLASSLPIIKKQLGVWLDSIFGEGFADDFDKAFNPLRLFDEIAQNFNRLSKQAPGGAESGGGSTAQGILDGVGDLNDDLPDVEDSLANLERLSERWADSFANGLTDIITEVESLEDVFRDLFQNISRIAVQELVAAPFRSFLQDAFGTALGVNSNAPGSGNTSQGSFTQPVQTTSAGGNFAQFEALGNAYQGGSITPFARGGIVHSPTTFGLSTGQRGLMGEQGPEAIMPLERGPDGALGLRNGGGGTTNVTQNFYGGIDGYRRSRRQMARDQQTASQRT